MAETSRLSARSLAAEVLIRVFRDGAFAAAALEATLSRRKGLDPRDKRLATELTYGVLRTAPYLESRLARLTPRGLDARRDAARAHLLLAAYQLLFLDRVPGFAAVNEAVSEVRRLRGAKLAGFANALLRKLGQEVESGPRPTLEAAIAESAAPWLCAALERALGEEGARAFLAAEVPPPLGLRVRVGADRAKIASQIAELAPHTRIEEGPVSPLALLARGAGDLRAIEPFQRAEVTIQEEGAQVVALALGVRPGERVLDACAGRGNKTALMAEIAAVDAVDLHPAKLERLVQELEHWGVRPNATFAVDWTVGPGDVPEGYDRVLVDAPCSGTGTLRRRPDLALRGNEDRLAELAAVQRRILAQAATRVRPGGHVVYAVCSVLREEAEEVVEAVLAQSPDLTLAPFPSELASRLAGGAPMLRLLPSVHGTDGYFLASLQRRI